MNETPQDGPVLLTRQEAAILAQVSERTIDNWRHDGFLTVYRRTGARVYLDAKEVEEHAWKPRVYLHPARLRGWGPREDRLERERLGKAAYREARAQRLAREALEQAESLDLRARKDALLERLKAGAPEPFGDPGRVVLPGSREWDALDPSVREIEEARQRRLEKERLERETARQALLERLRGGSAPQADRNG